MFLSYLGLGGFGEVLLIILLVVLFIKISNLKSRVTGIEKYLNSNRATDSSAVVQSAPQTAEADINLTTTDSQNTNSSLNDENVVTQGDKFIEWLKDDWMLKLGGLLLLIGFGWFTTYAFMNDWVGPNGRIIIGLLAGVLVLALGTWRIRQYINQGGVFLVIGSAIVLITVFAAQTYYNMFTTVVALGLMFLSAAYVSLVSYKYNSFAVAMSGLVLAFAAPILAGDVDNEISVFSYLMVVVLGTVWLVSLRKNWGALVLASVVFVLLYSLPHFGFLAGGVDQGLLYFAYAFGLIFFVSSVVNILRSGAEGLASFLWTAIINAIFVLAWIFAGVSEEWQSLVIALWMLVFAVGAFILFLQTKINTVFFVYAGVAVAYLASATAVELDGPALTFAFIVEFAVLPILINIITKNIKVAATSSLLLILPFILSLESWSEYPYNIGAKVFNEDFFVLLSMSIAMMVVGYYFKNRKGTTVESAINADNVLLISGSVYLYALIWNMLGNALYDAPEAAITVSLIFLTIAGLIKYFYGISAGSRTLRNYGGTMLGFVVLRLLFVDVWDMDIAPRIVVFFLVGLLLVSTAFISRKIKNNIV
jgi:uncharacterized membrane protein